MRNASQHRGSSGLIRDYQMKKYRLLKRRNSIRNGCATRIPCLIPGRATRAPTPRAEAFGRIPARKKCRIRIEGSEKLLHEADWLERGAKRTSVRERRLKGKMPAKKLRSVRTPQMEKRRSLERRNNMFVVEKWLGHQDSNPD